MLVGLTKQEAEWSGSYRSRVRVLVFFDSSITHKRRQEIYGVSGQSCCSMSCCSQHSASSVARIIQIFPIVLSEIMTFGEGRQTIRSSFSNIVSSNGPCDTQ